MKKRNDNGYTVLELLVAVGIIGILAASAVPTLKSMTTPLANASFTTEHFLQNARARAISDTQVVKVAATSSTQIGIWSSDSCSGTMTLVSDLFLKLPAGTSMPDTSWSICFTQRGLADATTTFDLVDTHGASRTVHVALGGGTKIDEISSH